MREECPPTARGAVYIITLRAGAVGRGERRDSSHTGRVSFIVYDHTHAHTRLWACPDMLLATHA